MAKRRKAITKEDIKKFIKNKLGTDKKWIRKALVTIYSFQTHDEKTLKDTIVCNGIGFNGNDGYILSSMAKQLIITGGHLKGKLTSKQISTLKHRMPRYWKQILSVSDIIKIKKLMIEEGHTQTELFGG